MVANRDYSANGSRSISNGSVKKKSMKKSNIDHIPVRANIGARLCNADSRCSVVLTPKRRSASLSEVNERDLVIANAKFHRTFSLRKTRENGSFLTLNKSKKSHRQRGAKRFLPLRQRREFGLESILQLSRVKFYSLSTVITLKLALAVGFVYLIVIDFHNSYYRVADVSKIRHTSFDVGTYPMSGMLLLASSSCLDAISVAIFACGFLCQCGYFRYYMRFVFVDFLMTFTAVCTLFISERTAVSFLKDFFKVVLDNEYGEPEAQIGTDFVDSIQESAKCCGFSKATDWTKSKWWHNRDHKRPYPWSCCTNKQGSVFECFSGGCETHIFPAAAYARIVCQYLAIVKTVMLLVCICLCAAMYRDFVISAANVISNSRYSRRQNGEFLPRRNHSAMRNAASVANESPVAIATPVTTNLFSTERQLFQIDECPSENQPSTVACESADGENVANTGGTSYGSVKEK